MSAAHDIMNQPDALFGMLIAAEGGASLSRMSELYGVAREQLVGVLELARRGECGRVPAADGSLAQVSTQHGKNAGPIASDTQEVLLQRWMRRIARHLNRHGEISLDQVRNLIGQGEIASVQMDHLRRHFKNLGIKFISEIRGGKNDLFYVIEGESLDKLSALVEAGWRVEVVR